MIISYARAVQAAQECPEAKHIWHAMLRSGLGDWSQEDMALMRASRVSQLYAKNETTNCGLLVLL